MKTVNIKPKPCPFCGKKPTVARGGPGDDTWYVQCDRWDWHQVTIQNEGTRNEAVSMWNQTRSEGVTS